MSLTRQALFVAGLGCAGLACTDTTSPSVPRASAVVQRDTIVPALITAGTVTWLRFTVAVTVHNTGTAALAFDLCESAVEVQAGSGWGPAWSPICALVLGSGPVIPAGASRELTVDVKAAVQGPGYPDWRATTVDGTYRLLVALASSGARRADLRVTSNAFILAGTS